MTKKQSNVEPLKAVPEPIEDQRRVKRRSERETYAVYRLPDDDADSAEREFLMTLPADSDVERRIKREYGAGSYRIETRRGGRFVSVYEMHLDGRPERDELSDESGEEQETNSLEDLEERIEAAVLRAMEARRAARAREKATHTPQAPAQPVDPVQDALRLLRSVKELNKELEPEPLPIKATTPEVSEEDRALLSLLKDRELRNRIASSLTSVLGSGEGGEIPWYGLLISELNQRPRLIEKILDRVLPEKDSDASDASDDEEEEGEIDASMVCITYLAEKCAANEAISFNDAPLRALAEQSPGEYQDLITGLRVAPVEILIKELGARFDAARIALKAPHAREWLTRLKAEASRLT